MTKRKRGASASRTANVTPPAVIQAFVQQALKADPVLADLKNDSEFNIFKPARMATPTLVLFGDRDPGVVQEDAAKFFARLASPDKQMVVLPGADHAAQIEDTHDAWIASGGGAKTQVYRSYDRGLTWKATKTPVASARTAAPR